MTSSVPYTECNDHTAKLAPTSETPKALRAHQGPREAQATEEEEAQPTTATTTSGQRQHPRGEK
eukprot:7527500-Pyramimonas_sp.AAC.1